MPINKISERSVDSILADGWSELHYVEVGIEGLPNTVMALDDSGAQLCVVRRDVIDPLCLHKIGQVTLRGMIDESVTADVVRMNVKLVDGVEYLPITCAVCEKLPTDVRWRLSCFCLFSND